MRILQLGKFYPIQGGVEKVMYDLMCGLSNRGIDCDMMCAALDGSQEVVKVNERGRVLTFPTIRKVAGTMIAPSIISELRKICSDYDIIHVHHPDPMVGLALWLSGFKGKVVLHWHSDIVKQKLALAIYRPIQNWLLRRANVIVGTTPVYLKESPYLQNVQHKIKCLPIGIEPIVDVPEDKVSELRKKYEGKKIVFSLGRLVPYKGYDYLIEAAQYTSDDCVILIGGAGPMYNELKEKIKELGLTGKVELLGRVSNEDLPVYYHACDIYCMSSIQKTEAFGIVQIEAMSCGKPLIATNIPESGVSWVNKHGVSGLNVTPMKPREIADAIHSILSNKDTYQRLAYGSSERFKETFHIDKMIEGCQKIYECL